MDTRMPAQGSNTTVFTPYTGVLPEKVTVAMNAGFSFFKLMCIGTPIPPTIFGFFDVNVKQIIEQVNIQDGLRFETQWHRGRGFEKNEIRLTWDKSTQRSYAYIPDDPAWKNRLIYFGMRDSGKFIIAQYLTPKGLIDGTVFSEQIKYIGSRLYENVVTCGEDTLFRSANLQEAKDFEADLKEKDKTKKCQVVSMPTVEVAKLIKKHKSEWITNDEFIFGIRAQIEAEIEEKFAMVPQQQPAVIEDPKAFLKDAFSLLSPAERLELFQGMAAAAPKDTVQTKPDPMPIPSAGTLDNMAMDQLKALAEDHDIFTMSMQREDIIKALKEKSGQKVTGKQKAPAVQKEIEVIT